MPVAAVAVLLSPCCCPVLLSPCCSPVLLLPCCCRRAAVTVSCCRHCFRQRPSLGATRPRCQPPALWRRSARCPDRPRAPSRHSARQRRRRPWRPRSLGATRSAPRPQPALPPRDHMRGRRCRVRRALCLSRARRSAPRQAAQPAARQLAAASSRPLSRGASHRAPPALQPTAPEPARAPHSGAAATAQSATLTGARGAYRSRRQSRL